MKRSSSASMNAGMIISPSQAWSILTRHARDEIEPLRLQELCHDQDRVSALVAVYNTISQAHSMTTTNQSAESEPRMVIADLSRQRMTLETLNHLLKLATARKLRQFITQLAWGQNDPRHPIPPKRIMKKSQQQQKQQQQQPSSTPSINAPPPPPPPSSAGINLAAFPTDHCSCCASMHLALRVPANQGYEMLTLDGTNALVSIHHEWHRIEDWSDRIRRGEIRGVTGNMMRLGGMGCRGSFCPQANCVINCRNFRAVANLSK